jgi:hypothetical protein
MSGDARHAFRTAPGGVAIIVESSQSATARGATPIARITGHASISASPDGPSAEPEDRANTPCAAGSQAPTLALATLLASTDAPVRVLGSGNGTWIDRAEQAAARAGVDLQASRAGRMGDFFAAGPLLDIVLSLEEKAGRLAALCTDFTGHASAVMIEGLRT